MEMFIRRFTKFFKKKKSEKRESRNKNKSSEKGQFQGCFKYGKMDHMIKDCPLLKEEQRRNSKKQQELASKAFKKAMKATWGETSDEKSEGEDGEGNLALMAKSDTDSDNDSSELEETVFIQKTENSKLKETASSLKAELNTIKDKKASSSELSNNDQGLHEAEIVSLKRELCKEKKINSELQVSTPTLNEGTLLETDSLNVPSEPRQELKNSGGTNFEIVVSLEEGTGDGTSSDPIPEA
ncbi:hypothetical protein HAX54_038663 [Datura stramonium]|uniref:Uncharacterized protein n=1 Tax=Datura stramonium TaxID=4076 RepID=A0ABS8SID8_DATST|nr:hypothetical protein [Datura stramonium]